MTTDVFAAAAARVGPDRVLVSGAAFEEAARVWNGAVTHRPALVVRARNPADVQAAVLVAREHRLPLSVRGGGHDWAGRALRPGGLVIDLSGMRQVAVDPEARIATVAGGATVGDVIAAAAPYGLVAAGGTVGGVGMAGLTLGGGYGPFIGRFGLALDNLVGAEVVLADGRLVTAASADDGADDGAELYWALRGGGGNFGVVTSMRVRLHPLPRLLAGFIMYPWSSASQVLTSLDTALAVAPDELTVQSGIMPGPDGGPVVFLSAAWSGAEPAGERAIGELLRLGTPLVSQVAPTTYADMLTLFDTYVIAGRHHVGGTRTVAGCRPDVVAALVAGGATRTSPLSSILVHHFHGAATRVPVEATAFGIRREHLVVEIVATWEPDGRDDARHRAWTRSVSAALAPAALPGGYPNMLGPDDHDQIRYAYGPNAARLRDAKRRFDPDGIFAATPVP